MLLASAMLSPAAAQQPRRVVVHVQDLVGPEARAYQLPVNPKAKVSKFSIDPDEINLVDYDFVEAGTRREALTDRFTATVAPAPPE